MLTGVNEDGTSPSGSSLLDEIVRDGARRMLAAALEAEANAYMRTTNPIESTFSTVRLRTKVTRGAGSRTSAVAMVFKLVESAQ